MGKALFIPWRGKLRVIGLKEKRVIAAFESQQRLTYWKQALTFSTHPEPDFPNERKADDSYRGARHAAAGNRTGAEGIIDFAGLDCADGKRRAHGDDFCFNPVFAVKAAFARRPHIQKSQRLRRHRDANFLETFLGAPGGRGSRNDKNQTCPSQYRRCSFHAGTEPSSAHVWLHTTGSSDGQSKLTDNKVQQFNAKAVKRLSKEQP